MLQVFKGPNGCYTTIASFFKVTSNTLFILPSKTENLGKFASGTTTGCLNPDQEHHGDAIQCRFFRSVWLGIRMTPSFTSFDLPVAFNILTIPSFKKCIPSMVYVIPSFPRFLPIFSDHYSGFFIGLLFLCSSLLWQGPSRLCLRSSSLHTSLHILCR